MSELQQKVHGISVIKPGMKVQISVIKPGMKVQCLKCLEPITISKDTVVITPYGEYIHCPNCDYTVDIIHYHLHGRLIDDEGRSD